MPCPSCNDSGEFCPLCSGSVTEMDPRFLINNIEIPEDTFVPDRLYYHTDFTDTVKVNKTVGRRTLIEYGDNKFYIPSSIIKKENQKLYIHTQTFRRILLKETGTSTFIVPGEVTNNKLLEEIRELKDSVKNLTKIINGLNSK